MEFLENVTLYDLTGQMNYVTMEAIIQSIADFNDETQKSYRVNVNEDFQGEYVKNSSNEKITQNDIELLLGHIARFIMGINVTDTYKVAKDGVSEGIIKRDAPKLSTEEIFTMAQLDKIIDPKSFGRPEVQKMLEKISELRKTNSKTFPSTSQSAETTEIVLETPKECKTAVEYGLQIINNTKGSEEDVANMRREYFNMLMLDLLSNNGTRTLDNYGIIKDATNNKVRMQPLSNNSGMTTPGIPNTMMRINIFVCDRQSLRECLYKYYYDDIKDLSASLTNSEKVNLESIDYLTSTDLDEQDKSWVQPIIEDNYGKMVSLEKEKRTQRGEPEEPNVRDIDMQAKLALEINENIKQNLIQSKEKTMGELKKKKTNKMELTNNEYGFIGVISILTVFLIACCFCILAISLLY